MSDLAEDARHTRLHLRFWLPVSRAVLFVAQFVLGPVRVRGSYRVPKKGGVLILANHVSDIDPALLVGACPRATHAMAKSELFEMPVVGRVLRGFGSFPVSRGKPDRAALRQAATLLRAGDAVVVFPEGQLSEDGELQEIKGGVALIIRMTPNVPVICCGLRGTDRIMPYGKTVPRPAFHAVEFTWGEPRIFDNTTPNEQILGWIEGQLRELSSASNSQERGFQSA